MRTLMVAGMMDFDRYCYKNMLNMYGIDPARIFNGTRLIYPNPITTVDSYKSAFTRLKYMNMNLLALLTSITDDGYAVTFSKKEINSQEFTGIHLHIKLEMSKPDGSGKFAMEIPCVDTSEKSIGVCLALCMKEFKSFHIDKDHKEKF